jgi:hypothetical protein
MSSTATRVVSLAGMPVVARPRIFANRAQIDDRFPVLGFTIDTAGAPFYEVLLTTDRSLFDPANASRRASDTFYSSRQDGGLGHAEGTTAIYVVPTAVLRSFSKS